MIYCCWRGYLILIKFYWYHFFYFRVSENIFFNKLRNTIPNFSSLDYIILLVYEYKRMKNESDFLLLD